MKKYILVIMFLLVNANNTYAQDQTTNKTTAISEVLNSNVNQGEIIAEIPDPTAEEREESNQEPGRQMKQESFTENAQLVKDEMYSQVGASDASSIDSLLSLVKILLFVCLANSAVILIYIFKWLTEKLKK